MGLQRTVMQIAIETALAFLEPRTLYTLVSNNKYMG